MSTITTKRASYPLKSFKALDKKSGSFEAVVAVFGNVDLIGDRVVKGAFTKSIGDWTASGDPIPVIFSHQWDDLDSHVGYVLPADLKETDEGLQVKGQFDMDQPGAARLFELMAQRRIKEFSFAYDVIQEAAAKDGANELLELGLIEVGPTLKGMNPETRLVAAKHLLEALDGDTRRQIAAELTADLGEEEDPKRQPVPGDPSNPDTPDPEPVPTKEPDATDDDAKSVGTVFVDVVPRLKVGRVLSSKNEQDLRDARDAIVRVLQTASASDDEGKSTDNAKDRNTNSDNAKDRGPSPSSVLLAVEMAALDA